MHHHASVYIAPCSIGEIEELGWMSASSKTDVVFVLQERNSELREGKSLVMDRKKLPVLCSR
jgi:hypothetical protein